MTLREMVGRASSLSAINLDYQGFTNIVHEYVHEMSHFSRIGTFFCVFFVRLVSFPSGIVYKQNAPTMESRGKHCTTMIDVGFATMCVQI